jgi:hypothetical protein
VLGAILGANAEHATRPEDGDTLFDIAQLLDSDRSKLGLSARISRQAVRANLQQNTAFLLHVGRRFPGSYTAITRRQIARHVLVASSAAPHRGAHHRHNTVRFNEAKLRHRCPDHLRHGGWKQMRVMPLGHPDVRMAGVAAITASEAPACLGSVGDDKPALPRKLLAIRLLAWHT